MIDRQNSVSAVSLKRLSRSAPTSEGAMKFLMETALQREKVAAREIVLVDNSV
jgi:hypothetical protein